MGTVIGLTRVTANARPTAVGFVSSRGGHTGFSRRDLADLDDWMADGRRAVVCSSENGIFAMLHEPGRSWASWGVVRQSRSILLWDCVTHSDIGRFATMVEALVALGCGGGFTPVENVFQIAGRQSHRTRPTA